MHMVLSRSTLFRPSCWRAVAPTGPPRVARTPSVRRALGDLPSHSPASPAPIHRQRRPIAQRLVRPLLIVEREVPPQPRGTRLRLGVSRESSASEGDSLACACRSGAAPSVHSWNTCRVDEQLSRDTPGATVRAAPLQLVLTTTREGNAVASRATPATGKPMRGWSFPSGCHSVGCVLGRNWGNRLLLDTRQHEQKTLSSPRSRVSCSTACAIWLTNARPEENEVPRNPSR
jgi:hypothetical protein